MFSEHRDIHGSKLFPDRSHPHQHSLLAGSHPNDLVEALQVSISLPREGRRLRDRVLMKQLMNSGLEQFSPSLQFTVEMKCWVRAERVSRAGRTGLSSTPPRPFPFLGGINWYQKQDFRKYPCLKVPLLNVPFN